MIIIIDAYNMLKQLIPSAEIGDRDRSLFINRLARYASLRRHTIISVFDGGPYQWPSKEKIQDIQVIFSGTKRSADEVIKDLLELYCTKDILLVTTDRALNTYANNLSVPSLDSVDFNLFLRQALEVVSPGRAHKRSSMVKSSESNNILVDSLMEQDKSLYVKDSQMDSKELFSQRLRKSDRRLLAILKKL